MPRFHHDAADMRNIRLTIEYDGTNYHGWQIQDSDRTVQQTLRDAIQQITGEEINLIGAGRTDAGVHAEGQVANFRSQTRISTEQLPFAINSALPRDVAVKHAEDVPLEFHARFGARSKLYRYLIWNDRIPSPLNRHRYAWVRQPLDLTKMQTAATGLVGTHDFQSFSTQSRDKNTERTVTRLAIEREGCLFRLEIEANGFLYNMVRAISGTLIDVGRGHTPVEQVEAMLQARSRKEGGPVAPAPGLYLVRVDY